LKKKRIFTTISALTNGSLEWSKPYCASKNSRKKWAERFRHLESQRIWKEQSGESLDRN
jgi:hypothetical protein